jgi:hypothetical protein
MQSVCCINLDSGQVEKNAEKTYSDPQVEVTTNQRKIQK